MLKKALPILIALAMVSMAAGSVASVSEIEYDDGSEEFRLFFISSETAESIDTTVTFQELSEQVDDASVENDVNIFVDQQRFEARYDTVADAEDPVPRIELVNEGFGNDRDAAEEWAHNNCISPRGGDEPAAVIETNYGFSWSIVDYEVYCAIEDENDRHNIARLQSPPDEIFETTWAVGVDGNIIESGTVSNAEIGAGRAVNLGEDVRVVWEGNLDTGVSAPNPDNELAAYNPSRGWIVINQRDYDQYQNMLRNDLQRDLGIWADGNADRDAIQSEYDEAFHSSTSEYRTSPLYDTRTEGGFHDGMFIKELDQNPAFPAFRLDIDADQLNIVQGEGEPEIINVEEPEQLAQDESQSIEVSVRNEGDMTGGFEARISSCTDNFSFASTSDSKEVEPGEIHTFSIPVSFSGNFGDDWEEDEKISGNCDISVEDINSGNTVTASANVEGVLEGTPSDGAWGTLPVSQMEGELEEAGYDLSLYEGDQDVIYQWSEGGTQREIHTVCEADEFAELQSDGSYECVEAESPEGTEADECVRSVAGFDLYEDPVCNFLNTHSDGIISDFSTADAVQWFLTIIVSVIAFGIGYNKLPEFANIESEPTKAAIGLALGLLSAFIFFGVWNNILTWILLPILAVLYIKFGWIVGLAVSVFK